MIVVKLHVVYLCPMQLHLYPRSVRTQMTQISHVIVIFSGSKKYWNQTLQSVNY